MLLTACRRGHLLENGPMTSMHVIDHTGGSPLGVLVECIFGRTPKAARRYYTKSPDERLRENTFVNGHKATDALLIFYLRPVRRKARAAATSEALNLLRRLHFAWQKSNP